MPVAVSVTDGVLAVHVMAVVAGFGSLFALPIIFSVAARTDPDSLPAVHRAALVLTQRLINPGVAVTVAAGTYLASSEHAWKSFYVGWGIGAALLIGGVVGMFMIPRQRRLIELVDARSAGREAADVATTERLARELSLASMGLAALVLVTILFMALHLGS